MTHMAATDLISVNDAAIHAGVAPQTLYSLVKANKFWHTSRGRQAYIRREDMNRYMDERERRAREGVRHNVPYHPFSQVVEAPSAPVSVSEPAPIENLPSASAFSDIRAKIAHELGAIRHQIGGISAQIATLEAEANRLIAQEEQTAAMLAKADDLEAFLKKQGIAP